MKSSYVIHLKVGTNFFEHIFNICSRFENIRRTYIWTGLKNIRKLVRLKINLKTNKQLEWKEQLVWFTTVNLFIFTFGMFLHNAQPVFTCSKSALKTSKQCVKYVNSKNAFIIVTEAVLVSLLLTLNRFHIYFTDFNAGWIGFKTSPKDFMSSKILYIQWIRHESSSVKFSCTKYVWLITCNDVTYWNLITFCLN